MPQSPNAMLPISHRGKSKRTYYVVFCEAEELPFFARIFTKPPLSHCFILVQNGPVCTVVEQSNYAIMQHAYWNKASAKDGLDVEYLARVWLRLGFTIVKFEVDGYRKSLLWHPCNILPTCVSLCKNLMGVKTFVQTPHGFYSWLVKNGGKVLEVNDG